MLRVGLQKEQPNISKIVVLCLAAADMPIADLVKIDTEGSQIETFARPELGATSTILLKHHSKADAKLIKDLVAADFRLLRDESDREIGTMVFERLHPAARGIC